jgi:hypothetical protein
MSSICIIYVIHYSGNAIRKVIQERIHKRSFQHWIEVEYGFQLIGIKNISGQPQKPYRTAFIELIKRQLKK